MEFLDTLVKLGVPADIVKRVSAVPYEKSDDEKQDYANRVAAVLNACKAEIDPEILSEAMQARACCKGGYRLQNARAIKKSGAPLSDRLRMLAEARHMGHAEMTASGTLLLTAVGKPGGTSYVCPCWRLRGHMPSGGAMPAEYCMCCAGHFRFHYEKALERKLHLVRVVSSIIASGGSEPCVFEYDFADSVDEK